jgi:transposase-like protein
MAKVRRKRKTYTSQQRSLILATARRDGLTASDVRKKFGVTPVTYYSWRKKSGVTSRGIRGVGRAARLVAGVDLKNQVRSEVRSKVRQILPEIVRGEINSYLSTILASGRGRRRSRA